MVKDSVEEFNHTLHVVTKYTPEFLQYGIITDIIPSESKKNSITNQGFRKQKSEKSENNITMLTFFDISCVFCRI